MTDPISDADEALADLADADVTRLEVDGKEILLVGTAHISQESVDTVQRVIADEQPDTVCVELDDERFEALTTEQRWEDLDLIEVIKQRQLTFLMARLALMAFQKRMGNYTGVKPGAEMAAAVEAAQEMGADVELVDRNVKITLLRAWRLTPWWRRAMLVASLVGGLFDSSEVGEDELAELRKAPNISQILTELGEAMPTFKQVLVDERDLHMAHHIRNAPGQRIVAIVGAAHVPGLIRHLQDDDDQQRVDQVQIIPPKSKITSILPWAVPALVIGLFVLGFFRADPEVMQNAAIAWVLANGIFSALGAIIALAHPLTVVTAFVAAPLTSLNPTIGAGWVCAFAQTIFAAPRVEDMENMGEDVVELKGWWKNRLARIFVVFVMTSLGSTLGTVIAFGWLKDLI